MKDLILAAMLWASNATGLPLADEPPKVILRSPCHILRIMADEPLSNAQCQRIMTSGPYSYALYDPDRQVIVLPRSWSRNSAYDMSVLIHETVHYLQDKAGLMDDASCAAIEGPAYKAQFKWLREQGVNPASLGLTQKLVRDACAGE